MGRCTRVKELPPYSIQKLKHLEMDFSWWTKETPAELHVTRLGALSHLRHLKMNFQSCQAPQLTPFRQH